VFGDLWFVVVFNWSVLCHPVDGAVLLASEREMGKPADGEKSRTRLRCRPLQQETITIFGPLFSPCRPAKKT